MGSQTNTISSHPTSYDTTNYSYASISSSYPITNAYTNSSSTTYCQVNWKTGSNAESYVYLKFDFSSIPDGATIDSITAKAKGYVSTTTASRVATRQMQLCTGTTLKGKALTMSNSASEQTFSNVGSWTAAEVKNAGVRYYVKRGTSNTSSNYSFRMYGATMTVTYSYQTYTVTVTNSTTATVVANPNEVASGSSSELTADTISGITIKDGTTDITSQFQPKGYTVSMAKRGDYGFALNSNDYFESTNKGVDKSCAVVRLTFNLASSATIEFQFINYAEQGYDFGVFGNIDTALNTDYYAAGSSGATITDSSYKLACNTSTYNKSTVRTLSYSMSAGEHYIDIKYSKDDASAANNDTLQFKYTVTMSDSSAVLCYTYTLTNITSNKTITVAVSGGQTDIIYYKNNGSWVAATSVYKKVSGAWILQSDLTNVFSASVNYIKGS